MARVAVPLVGLTLGCTFDAAGLGSSSEVDLSGGTGSTGSTGSTGAAAGSSSSGAPGSSGEPDPDTGEAACEEGCPPTTAWTVTAKGVGRALVLDPGGDAIVAGDIAQPGEGVYTDIWVARFTGTAGVVVWQETVAGAEGRSDFARDLARTADGKLVVVGGSREVGGRRTDVWVGWLAADDGTLVAAGNLGTGHWNGTDPSLDEWVEGVAVREPEGDLVVVGSRCQIPCQVPDAWFGRFDADGNSSWAGDPMLSPSTGALHAVTLHAGEIFAVGTEGYRDTPLRSLIRRFSGDGGGTWSALQEPLDAGGFDAVDVAVTADGGVWVVGREIGTSGGFVRLYMPDRDDPVRELHGEMLDAEPTAVTIAADGDPVVAGSAGHGPARHLWVGRFSPELTPRWRIDETPEEAQEARDVAFDGDDALWVLGYRPSATLGARSWLRKYVPSAR